MSKKILFFDDGGVLNDNQVRGEQWKKYIPDYFTPKFGGERESWEKANVFAMGFVIDYLTDIQEKNLGITYKEYKEQEDNLWTVKMFEFMGLKPPPKSDYPVLVDDVYSSIIPKVTSAYPGIVDCIQKLEKDYILNTASNASSNILDLYLSGMNVRNYFTYLFGPDLVNIMKSNEEYYNRILKYSNSNYEKSIIIDDSPRNLYHAKKMGLEVIQSCLDGQKPEFENYITKVEELILLLSKIK